MASVILRCFFAVPYSLSDDEFWHLARSVDISKNQKRCVQYCGRNAINCDASRGVAGFDVPFDLRITVGRALR